MNPQDIRVNPQDIVMIGDIAQRQGVSRAAVQGWMRRKTFPAPVTHLRAGDVYDYSQIQQWRAERATALRTRAQKEEEAARR